MFREVAYYMVFGHPLIMYGGLLTFTSFSLTAVVGYLYHHGHPGIPFKWHPVLAGISITFAIIHGLMGLLSYL